jgi:hypothetical protein
MSDSGMLQEVVTALLSLNDLGKALSTPILLADVFSSVSLEVLCIPPDARSQTVALGDPRQLQVSHRALDAIGSALAAELDASGDDTARLVMDDGLLVLVFPPEARRTVVQATGVSLLPI